MSDFAQVRKGHEGLFDHFVAHRTEISNSPSEFIKKVRALLDEIAEVSRQVICVEDYTWLQSAVTNWRVTCSSALNSPIDFILPSPVQVLRVGSGGAKVWLKADLDGWLANKAFEIYRHRALAKYYSKPEVEILSVERSSPEEYTADGHAAKIYLAADVLDGKVSFVRDFTPETYLVLESDCWLENVVRLKAYFRWREEYFHRRAGRSYWGEESALRDYIAACNEVRRQLVNRDNKASQIAFERILLYLREKYMTYISSERAWRLDAVKAHDLIAVKAQRVRELSGREDSMANWLEAEKYVSRLYNNIAPAVLTDSAESVKAVVQVLQLGESGQGRDLANCFEAAIAVTFINAETVERLLEEPTLAAAA